jgi:uncharacterized protein (TIGR00730 family)
MKLTVYCASSGVAPERYRQDAYRLGNACAKRGVEVVFGGGGIGSMGALADGALDGNGQVLGIMPEFMRELEWVHPRVERILWTRDLAERKRQLMDCGDALVALPGGSGTLDELLEAITAKRLGLYLRPIVIVNRGGFFNGLLETLELCVSEGFMDPRHRKLWTVVDEVDAVFAAIDEAPPWPASARAFATRKPG